MRSPSATSSSPGRPPFARRKLIDRVRDQPGELTIAAFIIVIIAVIAIKAATGRGTPLRGGLPSGHAALAFAAWIAITYVAGPDHRFLVSTIAFVLALLVAQTRVESGVHSSVEVLLGGLLGALLALALFQFSRKRLLHFTRERSRREGRGRSRCGVRPVLQLPRRAPSCARATGASSPE